MLSVQTVINSQVIIQSWRQNQKISHTDGDGQNLEDLQSDDVPHPFHY